jgi:hypothetical protein
MMNMSEGVKEKAKARVKSGAKKAVAVVAVVLVALLALSTFSDAIGDAYAKAGALGGLLVKLKELGERVKSAFRAFVVWLSDKLSQATSSMTRPASPAFPASLPLTQTLPVTPQTPIPITPSTSTTPNTSGQPVEEVKEPVVLSVKAVPVKVSPKLFSDEVSSMEDPNAIVISKEFNNWVWTDECAHSGGHSIKGRAGFWLKLPTNRSDFNLYDRLVMYVKVVAQGEIMERLTGVIIGFDVPGWGPLISLPLKEGDYSWPKWGICKVKVSREGEWWRLEAYDIKWGCYDPWDRVGFTIVPDDPKLYNNVTFYVDDVQLYSSRSDACLLLVEARLPDRVLHDNKTYYYCVNSATVKNLRSGEVGTSNAGINDAVFRKERRGSSVNEVYVPISVQKGDVLEVTFTFTYYYNDGKYLHKDDALVFNRTVTVTVE